MVEAVIGLGVIFSLVYIELFGVAAGGIVVPGYIALHLNHPLTLAATLLISFLTFFSIKFLQNFMLIFGRRRLVVAILLGFLFGWISRNVPALRFATLSPDFQIIGYIIPGLIANWMERQGVWKTICALFSVAIFVRIIIIIIYGGERVFNV